jgi:hypothetical protein
MLSPHIGGINSLESYDLTGENPGKRFAIHTNKSSPGMAAPVVTTKKLIQSM